MRQFIAEHVKKLWGTWNIRRQIIISLLLQPFLTLFAPLRKQRGRKWIIKIPLWIAYFLADWVATSTVGLILHAEEPKDIFAFWAAFLLLHLGGPDTITSFSLEDNKFWKLGLIFQFGSTIFVVFKSLPQNNLWLPTLLVLISGIIKYAERNRAFYLASFDHFGNNWAYQSFFVSHRPIAMPPFPVQFEQPHRSKFLKVWLDNDPRSIVLAAACTVGAIKSLLVGPPMTNDEQQCFCHFMQQRNSREMLRIIEVHLSLLYELLHTKLPVVDSKIGYICRTVNFGCILGALVSFSILVKKHYDHIKLGYFDICLTYGLLIGALAMDLISILLLMSSDWIIVRQYSDEKNYDEFTHRQRWSNSVPQLNIFYCRFKNKDRYYLNKLVDFLGFETRRRIRRVSHKNFVEEEAWDLIFTMLREKDIGMAGTEIFGPSRILTSHLTNFAWTFNKFEYMESLLIWHIATEICYQKGCRNNCSTSNGRFDYRTTCKLISDYMFYLLVMAPSITAPLSKNLKIFKLINSDEKWKWPSSWEKVSKETLIRDLEKPLEEDACLDLDLLKEDVDKLSSDQRRKIGGFSRIAVSRFLAKELLKYDQVDGCPWEIMGRFWVEMLCYAAINCQPTVHARQVSRGGQLLTLVWLLINYLGLTPPSMDPGKFLFASDIEDLSREE